MADSVDGAPPDSWEVADVDAAVSRLMLSSKRESNNSSPNLTTSSSSEIHSDLLAPVRSSSGGVLDDLVNTVDQFLREALQNPRERLSVLRLEQDVEKFIRDPSQQQMEFPQLPTSYLRLAAHRVAQHYSLQSTVLLDNNLLESSGSRIIVHKTPDTRFPLIRLADIPLKSPIDDSTNNVVKVAIKQRPNKKSQITGSNSNLQRSESLKSVEERKEEYNRARARIFCSDSSTSGGKQESDARVSEVFNRGSLGALKAEEVSSSTGMNVNSGRGSVTSSGSASRVRLEEPVSRSRNNSKVAIFRDREVERKDPDYDRSYDRYAQRFDPGFGFNGGSYPVQPMYAPVLTYNTEFPQLGSAHTHRAPPISTEQHQSHTLAQHIPGPWVPPSSPAGLGYRPPESMVPPFNANHGSTLYMQYPSQGTSGVTFMHPHEQVHQQLAQSQQQSDASFGLANRPR
ncbi:putative R3H domain, SUZ domain, R3H domain superfamily protein [Helianthus annuus]|nr:putative R3H domain, SUZ domain, R3H domain superfamily protein [Helianthus annuus]